MSVLRSIFREPLNEEFGIYSKLLILQKRHMRPREMWLALGQIWTWWPGMGGGSLATVKKARTVMRPQQIISSPHRHLQSERENFWRICYFIIWKEHYQSRTRFNSWYLFHCSAGEKEGTWGFPLVYPEWEGFRTNSTQRGKEGG